MSQATFLSALANDILTYFYPISASIGVPCNLISVYIFWKLKKNKNNMGFLGMIQSIIDFALQLLFLFAFRSNLVFGRSLSGFSNPACKVLTFFRRFSLQISSWMHVIITFDRFTFVLYGHSDRFKFMKNKIILSFIMLAIALIIGFINIPNLYFYLNGRSCTADFPILFSADIIALCFRTMFPFLLMVVFNILMIRKLFRNNRETFKQSSFSRKEYQFTVSVLAYDAYFFILNSPHSLYYILYDVNLYSGALNRDPLMAASYSLANSLTAVLAFCVQTFSFFMYLAFNKLFRVEFFHLVGTIFCITSLKRVHSSSNTKTAVSSTNH